MKAGGKNVGSKKSNPFSASAEFALGYLYRDIETQLNNFGAENGGTITVSDAAERVAALLLAKTGGIVLDGAKHLPKVRGGSTAGHAVGSATASVHVRSRNDKPLKPKRTLSKKARLAIGKAQRERWARYHEAQGTASKKAAQRAA
jgi:type IV secretory pathway TrbL component